MRCNELEYFDVVLQDCYPCELLCERGEHARSACQLHCAAYLKIKQVDIESTTVSHRIKEDEPLSSENLWQLLSCIFVTVVIIAIVFGSVFLMRKRIHNMPAHMKSTQLVRSSASSITFQNKRNILNADPEANPYEERNFLQPKSGDRVQHHTSDCLKSCLMMCINVRVVDHEDGQGQSKSKAVISEDETCHKYVGDDSGCPSDEPLDSLRPESIVPHKGPDTVSCDEQHDIPNNLNKSNSNNEDQSVTDCVNIPLLIHYKTSDVYVFLDKYEPAKVYFFDDGKLEIHADYNTINYLKLIEELCRETGWQELEFRIKEYLPSSFTQCSLRPGQEMIHSDSLTNKKIISAIGVFMNADGYPEVYALSAGHGFQVGDECFVDNVSMGYCVEVIHQAEPYTIDLAIIQLKKNVKIDNTIFSSKGTRCSFRFPSDKGEVRDMELWKVQRKAHGNWQYGYLRYSCYTHKPHGLYRCVAVVDARENESFLEKGQSGSLVTSLPREDRLTVYGMLTGWVDQEADDGGDSAKIYVGFSLQGALEKSSVFTGKNMRFLESEY